jgi:ATP-dependent DNA ligase
MLYYYPNRPILLSPNSPEVEIKSQDPNWTAEIKYNGDRLCLHYSDDLQGASACSHKSFTFYGRLNNILKYQPSKELLDQLLSLNLPKETQLDGELMHKHTTDIKHKIFFYDIYVLKGKDVREDLKTRREILHDLIKSKLPNIEITEVFPTNFRQKFEEVTKIHENEGLVMKDIRGKIQFTTNKSYDVNWQLKIRKPTKNYAF